MTLGQILFYGGIGALLLTIAVGVLLWVKRPTYVPGDAVASEDGNRTQPFRSGYPTKAMSAQKEAPPQGSSPTDVGRTEKVAESKTATMGAERAPGTAPLGQGAAGVTAPVLDGETEKLEKPIPEVQTTAPLRETERLDPFHGTEETESS